MFQGLAALENMFQMTHPNICYVFTTISPSQRFAQLNSFTRENQERDAVVFEPFKDGIYQ